MTSLELEQRLEQVEIQNRSLAKQNRRMKLVGMAGLLGVVAILLMGQFNPNPGAINPNLIPPSTASSVTQFEVVRAKGLVIVDQAGTMVANLDAQGLTLFQGSTTATTLTQGELWLAGEGSAARLTAGSSTASLDLMEGGSSGFTRKVSITYSPEAGPGIELHH